MVIDHGLVIAAGTAEELKGRVGGDVVEFTVPDRSRIGDAVAAIAAIGEGEPHADQETGVVSVGVGGRGSDALVEAVRSLDAAGVETTGSRAAPAVARRRVPGPDRARRRGGRRSLPDAGAAAGVAERTSKDMERTAS